MQTSNLTELGVNKAIKALPASWDVRVAEVRLDGRFVTEVLNMSRAVEILRASKLVFKTTNETRAATGYGISCQIAGPEDNMLFFYTGKELEIQ